MKKLFAAVACLLLLSGCGNHDSDLPNRILTELSELSNLKLNPGNNRMKRYYGYYLPQGMGQLDSNELSEVLMKDGYRIIMNFDPSAIVIENYYLNEEEAQDARSGATPASLLPEDMLVDMQEQGNRIYYNGVFVSASNDVVPFTLQLMKNEGSYLVYMDGSFVKLYTYVPSAQVPAMIRAMFTLTCSVRYDEAKVLQAYSSKTLSQTKKQSLDYLEQHLPSSGLLEDLLNPKNTEDFESDMPE